MIVDLRHESPAPTFAGLRSVRPRRERCRLGVIHWTGGAGGPAAVYRTLRSRVGPRSRDGLSIHYVVGVDGEEVQMADDDLVCLHAGEVNDYSIGIEVVSPGMPIGAAYAREVRNGVKREHYRDCLKTKRPKGIALLGWTDAQTATLDALVERLSAKMGIARRVPVEADGSLMRRQMTAPELADFEGWIGHYHANVVKLDPGTRYLDRLRAKWHD